MALSETEYATLRRDQLAETSVAELAGQVVGFVTMGPKSRHPTNAHVAQLREIAMALSARRKGVANALLAHAITHAREKGYRKLVLTVLATNEAAIALYEQAGFVTEARLVAEFQLDGRWIDDLSLARHLDVGGASD